MYGRFTKLSSKNQAAVISMTLSVIWLLFGSSVNILSPTNGNLGFLFGSFSALLVLLGPLFYVKVRKIRVKNAKPLLIEPSAWLVAPLSFIATGIFFFFCFVVIAILSPGAVDAMDNETFLSNAITTFILLLGVTGPMGVYGIYTLTHYKKIIQYGTPEWKKVKAERKAAKRK